MKLKELTSIVTDLEESLPDFVTPYGLHKIVNQSLGTNLPPQMFYNYVSNGYISGVQGSNGKLQVSKTEVIRWIQKYGIQNIVSEF